MVLNKWGYNGEVIDTSSPTNTIDIDIDQRDIASVCETLTHIYYVDRSDGNIKRVDRADLSTREIIGSLRDRYLTSGAGISMVVVDDNTLLIADGGAYLASTVDGSFISDFHVDLPDDNSIDSCCIYNIDGDDKLVVGDKSTGLLFIKETVLEYMKIDPFKSLAVVDGELIINGDTVHKIDSQVMGNLTQQRVVSSLVLDDKIIIIASSLLTKAYAQVLTLDGDILSTTVINLEYMISSHKINNTTFCLTGNDNLGETKLLFLELTDDNINIIHTSSDFNSFDTVITNYNDIYVDENYYVYAIDDVNIYEFQLTLDPMGYIPIDMKPHHLSNPIHVVSYGDRIFVKSARFIIDINNVNIKHSILTDDIIGHWDNEKFIVSDTLSNTASVEVVPSPDEANDEIVDTISRKINYMELDEIMTTSNDIENACLHDNKILYINNNNLYQYEQDGDLTIDDGIITAPKFMVSINGILYIYCSSNKKLFSLNNNIATEVIDFSTISNISVTGLVVWGDNVLFQTTQAIHLVSLTNGLELETSEENDLVNNKIVIDDNEIYVIIDDIYKRYRFENNVAVLQETIITEVEKNISDIIYIYENQHIIYDDTIIEYNKYDDILNISTYRNIPNLTNILGQSDDALFIYNGNKIMKICKSFEDVSISSNSPKIIYGAYMYDLNKDIGTIGEEVNAAKLGLVYESIEGNRVLSFNRNNSLFGLSPLDDNHYHTTTYEDINVDETYISMGHFIEILANTKRSHQGM